MSLKPLSEFFSAIEDDPRISITHIGIYAELLQYWKKHNYNNPVNAYSHEIMRLAKISRATYQKIIKDLSEYGYIKYEPSYKRSQGSKLYIEF
jgi:DNA-binding MarR family transcriptional regulator